VIRTLIVEDDALVAEVHASYVERVPGFATVGVAHRATEALELLAAWPVDLVLLDFHLPDAGGLDMLRALRARTRAPVDVIAVTAARDSESIRQAIAQGVTQYLVKPFTFATFADKLERYARYRARVASAVEPDQAQVDALLGTLRGSAAGSLPKRLNASHARPRPLRPARGGRATDGHRGRRALRAVARDRAALPRAPGGRGRRRPLDALRRHRTARAPVRVDPLTAQHVHPPGRGGAPCR
jgi:response regulator of citrate/malate metabolism